jgi:hypothetical protein
VLDSGIKYVAELSDADEELGDRALQLLVAWLSGDQLTGRADEAERRWYVAQQWRAESGETLAVLNRFAALANLALPPDHDQRDVGFASELLNEHLEWSRKTGEADEAIRTIANLFTSDLVSGTRGEELLAEGEQLIGRADDQGRLQFMLAAEHFCRGQFIQARDADHAEEAEAWAVRVQGYSTASEDHSAADLSELASLASQYHMAEDYPRAADCYRRIIDQAGLDDGAEVQYFALIEGALRLRLGDYPRAREALTELLPYIEARYLTAVLDHEIADAEHDLVETVESLAVAQAAENDWDEVLRTLDRSSGLRLRYRSALRDQADGRRVLELERELDAATRGAVAATEAGVSIRARLLEEYRRVRAQLPAGRMESPALADVAGVLAADEALAVLTAAASRTLVVVFARENGDWSASGVAAPEWDWDQWMLLLAGGDQGGWLEALIDPHFSKPAGALAWTLEQVESGPVSWLRELLPPGITRLTLVPHGVLNLIPWWAAPGIQDLDVVVGPSTSEVVRARRREERGERRALMVGNPTLDLPTSGVACSSVARRLADAGFEVAELAADEATEPSFLGALQGQTLLHFAGHGRVERHRTALELHPGTDWDGDPFAAWGGSVTEWRTTHDADEDEDDDEGVAPSERWADIEDVGRLYERYGADGSLARFLEHRSGTLAATYAGDRLVRLSELWSASDILIGDEMRSCRLAVLCACQSGAGAGRGDETPSLAAAFAIAGVDTVVGSLWQVEEPLAAIWVTLLYEQLADAVARDATVDISRLIRDASARLRALDRDEAERRLFELSDETENPLVRLELEAYADGLDDPPFADAWRWAAFYAAGRPTVVFAGGDE